MIVGKQVVVADADPSTLDSPVLRALRDRPAAYDRHRRLR